mgnify:FL=1
MKLQNERLSLFSITGIAGDPNVGKIYRELMFSKLEILPQFEKFLPRGCYGKDIDLILLECYVEGSHNWFTIPDKIKLGRYSSKEKAVSVKIPMLKEISDAFLSGNVAKVNEFLLETFKTIGDLIDSSKPLAKLDFDAIAFRRDYQVFMEHLLDDAPH